MPEPQTLMTGLALGESPRWHEDRLWFSDWGAQEVIAVDVDGRGNAESACPGPPSLGRHSAMQKERALCRFAHRCAFSSHGNASCRPTIPPRAGPSGELSPQLTAFLTSAPILASSAAVNSFSAKATGHMAPSSRVRLVAEAERRVPRLELLRALEE